MSIKEVDIYIDSKNRNKFYKNILTKDIFYLEKNPIFTKKNSNQLEIFIPNHNLVKDDLILIENVVSESINDIFNIYLDTNRLKIDITSYLEYFKNFLKYDIIFNNSSNIIFNTFNVKVVSYSDEYSSISAPVNELFIAELKSSKVLYEDNFVSFALRYKYNDNGDYQRVPYQATRTIINSVDND